MYYYRKAGKGIIKRSIATESGSKGERYALWIWKGDYWNLESGAEIGLYNEPRALESVLHYNAIDFELPMTLGLYNYYSEDEIECIFNWAPKERQWWITGFNPEYDEPECNDMVVIGSIDFEGRECMFEAMKNNIKKKYSNLLKYFIFDENGYTVWIIWDKKEANSFD